MVIGVYLATFLASISILISLLTKYKRTTNVVILFSIVTAIQSFGRVIVACTMDLELAWLGNMFIYVGACFCPLIVIIVLNNLCKLNIPKWILYLIIGYTILVYCLTLTIGNSEIYYKSFQIVQGKNFNYLEKEYGPAHNLYLIMILLDFVIIIVSLIIAIKKYRKVSLRTIRPIAILASVILISYILQKVFKTHISYLSIGYFLSLLFCIHFLGHVNTYDIGMNIVNCVEKNMENAYIQFDEKFRCAGYNDKFVKLFPEIEKKWTVDEKIPADDSFEYNEIIKWFLNHTKDEKKTIQIGENYYELTVYEIPYGKKACVGYMLELYDRTAENKYLETVKNYNENLEQEVYKKTKHILQLNDAFGKAVDPEVRDYLLKGNVKLGGETKDITVMFCDIRSFTAMSENMPPAQIVSMLNFYFTVLAKCISKNHGIINKYIGDAIMAIFGAPVPSKNHALDAYNAAQDMRAALVKINKQLKNKGWPEVHFGIGIHSGPALAGNIGATNRMEYTVIGDTVNTASRVENLCKTYQTDLLITESTAEKLGTIQKTLKYVDESQIRGKSEKVKLYN